MGYRGKVVEQDRARELRALDWALQDIADELGVSKSGAFWQPGESRLRVQIYLHERLDLHSATMF